VSRIRPPEFHPALLIIDMQNGFCSSGGSYEKYGATIGADPNVYQRIVPNIARLAPSRSEKNPVLTFLRGFTVSYRRDGLST